MNTIIYTCSINYYYKSGMLHSKNLTANSLQQLQQQKKEILNAAKNETYEVITFGKTIITTTQLIENSNSTHYFVKKTNNKYLGHLSKK